MGSRQGVCILILFSRIVPWAAGFVFRKKAGAADRTTPAKPDAYPSASFPAADWAAKRRVSAKV